MNKKKVCIYLLSIIIPMLIFLLCTFLVGYLPFKSEMLNAYDSFTQYPGILLEYMQLIKSGNIFYSWGAGLGFNFFGTMTYYCMSPLNLFAMFATPYNYPFFITAMTFLRFALLGFTMCFYLDHKKIRPLYVVVFSVLYSLMGYSATYYYNFIWIDSIIMLPIVIYGLDKLIEGKSPACYIIALAFTIMINYYIGYMICIFSAIWFIYKIVSLNKSKKKVIKTFVISSLFAGLISSVVILPSLFALLTGKASIYGSVDYSGFTKNALTFIYTLTAGSYATSDQIAGPAQVYCSVLVLILTIFYFFNKKYTKRQKIATVIVLLFFYLSFSLRFLNYAWQLFQKPIWWQSRFSFVFSFLLITIACDVLMNIKHTNFKTVHRIIVTSILIVLLSIGAFVKWSNINHMHVYTYFFFGFSILIIIEMMFLLDRKGFLAMLLIFTLVEVSLNTFNSLKQNYRYKSYTHYEYIKRELPPMIRELDNENDNFYRMEFIDDFSSNDGLYFGFNGINYFNSTRNIKVVNLMEKLGLKVSDHCHFILDQFDPILLSVFNIKYLYGTDAEYYKEVNKNIFENPYPLALGFMSKDEIQDFNFKSDNPYENRENLFKSLSGLNDDIYKTFYIDEFEKSIENDKNVFRYSFKSDGHYLIIPENLSGKISVNGIELSFDSTFREILKGDEVVFKYSITGGYDEDEIKVTLFDLDNYEKHAMELNKNLLHAETDVEGHILKSSIDVDNDDEYLFTSIEYEKGMRVYVDNKEVEPDILLDTLIGLKLDKGHHEIIIDYIPKGFISGVSLSVVSAIGAGIWCFYGYKKKKYLN